MKKINTQEFLTKIGKKIKAQEMLTKIPQDRNKIILAVLIIIIILYLDFSLILKPQMRMLAAITPKIVKLRKDLHDLNSNIIKMQEQEVGFKDTRFKKLATPDQISWLIEEISRLANQQEVRISQIRPVRTLSAATTYTMTGNYSPELITLEVTAGYHQLGRFLAEFENHPILMEVEDLDIKHSEKNPFEQKIKLDLKIYVTYE